MQLSYTVRLICLALCSGGLLQLLTEALAWLVAPFLFRQAAGRSARDMERSLFFLALFTRLGPWIVVTTAWVPAYMRGEDNLSAERVGFVCLAGAAAVSVRLLFSWDRLLRGWFVTKRLCAVSKEIGRSPGGLPVMLYPGERPLLAVVGLFRSRVIIAQLLLASGQMPANVLEIAFRHEEAHARQRDTLKFLLLSMLPHVTLATRTRRSLCQQWRLAAEMAADEEGAMGRSDRSVLLAELLVTMAKNSNGKLLGAFALLSPAEDLCARVDRLLQNSAPSSPKRLEGSVDHRYLCMILGLALSAALLVVICYSCVHAGHRSAEVLLHLG